MLDAQNTESVVPVLVMWVIFPKVSQLYIHTVNALFTELFYGGSFLYLQTPLKF